MKYYKILLRAILYIIDIIVFDSLRSTNCSITETIPTAITMALYMFEIRAA